MLFMSDFGIAWGITKQIVTDVIGEYLKFFPLSWEYSSQLSALGNIPNFEEIILNIHLTVSNYLYNLSDLIEQTDEFGKLVWTLSAQYNKRQLLTYFDRIWESCWQHVIERINVWLCHLLQKLQQDNIKSRNMTS